MLKDKAFLYQDEDDTDSENLEETEDEPKEEWGEDEE